MTVKKILCLLLVFSLLCLSLLGCKKTPPDTPKPNKDPGEKASALAVTLAARDFLSSAVSYRETVTSRLSFRYNGADLVMKQTDDARYYGIGSSERFFAESTVRQAFSYGGAEEQKTVSSGYQDGKMYLSDGENKLCSPLTAEEYLQYLSLDTDGRRFLSELEDSERVGYRQESDGYTVTFTDLSAEKLDALNEKFSSFRSLAQDAAVQNVSVTVKFDQNARPIETKMDFAFSSDRISMTVLTEYGEWNAVSAVKSVDLSDYSETGDLRKISEISEKIETLKKPQNIAFSVLETTEKTVSRTVTESTASDVTVTVSPAYSYAIRQTLSTGAALSFDYQNGEEAIETKLSTGETLDRRKVSLSESDAKAKISDLLGFGDLTVLGVSDVSILGNTVYFSLSSPDTEAYRQNYTILSSSALLAVVTDGDRIVSYTYTLYFDGADVNLMNDVSVTVTKTVTLR